MQSTIGKNRYTFDEASKSIKSKVKGLSLTNQDGSPKAIQNLTEPIFLTLENEEKAHPPKNFTAYCELMRDIHRVDATVNSSIIVLNARAMNDSFSGFFFLFMNKGFTFLYFILLEFYIRFKLTSYKSNKMN